MSPVPGNPSLSWKRVSRRFRAPLRTATGEYAVRESIVVRVVDAAGRVGYGEVSPWPGFPVETLDEAERSLRAMANPDSGYASPPCFLHELPSDATPPVNGGPCLTSALSHARDWIDNDRGAADFASPCAGLLRDAEDVAAARAKCAAGFSTLKLKIGRGPTRDEQRAVSLLIAGLADFAPVRFRLDANGALGATACEAWCDFLSEFSEVEWLEQPMPVGAESAMREIAERAGVAGRIALDESACLATALPADWPGVLAVKPLLLGDLATWRQRRALYPHVAYASVFESPFGRQSALCVAAEASSGALSEAVGFDTLGVFDDDLDAHAPGPVARTLPRPPSFWNDLWSRL